MKIAYLNTEKNIFPCNNMESIMLMENIMFDNAELNKATYHLYIAIDFGDFEKFKKYMQAQIKIHGAELYIAASTALTGKYPRTPLEHAKIFQGKGKNVDSQEQYRKIVVEIESRFVNSRPAPASGTLFFDEDPCAPSSSSPGLQPLSA